MLGFAGRHCRPEGLRYSLKATARRPALQIDMITRAQLIDVLFVIVPQSLLLDIAGPAEAFRLANLHREARGLPPRFHLRFAGPSPTLPTSVGLTLGDLVPLPDELGTPT